MKYLKPILLFSAIIGMVTSCTSSIDKSNQYLVISDVHINSFYDPKDSFDHNTKYRYEFKNTCFSYYTDTLYSVGDTLKLIKK